MALILPAHFIFNIKHITMKTQSMFNIQEFLTFITNLPEQLPPNSPIAKQLQQQSQQWLSTVTAALVCLDDAESKAVIQQIKPFLLNTTQQEQPIIPPVEDINKTTKKKTTKAKKTAQKDSDKPAVPIKAELNETLLPQEVEPPIIGNPGSTEERLWQKLADENALWPNNPIAQQAELCRWYSWRLVNAKNGKELHDLINQWKTLSPEQQPQSNDIVVYSPVSQAISKEVSSPLWIGEASLFPEFAQYFGNDHNAQVWLTFQEPIERYQSLEQFQWFNDHSDTLPLWRRWYDLRYWAILAPEVASVFINSRYEQVSEQREAIGKRLSKIQHNFVARLQQPTEYIYIAENLHLIYSAFYQFLLPEDVASKYPQHLFAALRTAANDNLKNSWLSALDIEELHEAGFPKKPEYLAGVYKDTDKSVRISKSHRLLTEKNLYEADKVLYWLSPKWKQNNPPTQRAELLGNVLYCD